MNAPENRIGELERETQQRIVALLRDTLGYEYLGNWKDRDGNANVEEDRLRAFLQRRKVKPALIDKAVKALLKESKNLASGLYDANKAVYTALRYGIKVREGVGDKKQTVWLIDWENPENNDFAFAEEVTIKGQHDKRPDIVLYVNGIALGVLELKRSTIMIEEGIRQCLSNQTSHFIEPFFSTIQFVLAGNNTQGIRYGTVKTPVRFFLRWKEEDPRYKPDPKKSDLDNHLRSLCSKERFLELIHDFVAFHRGRKKLCRPNQYFGVKAAQTSVRSRTGGIIWHTQGSGKSLTMVWLAQWILKQYPEGRVLIVTDRDELDEQIERDFTGVGKEIHRTKSGADMLRKLQSTTSPLMCSLIQKCRGYDNEPDIDAYVEELGHGFSDGFKPKGDLFVFVDECHRTQSGKLHKAIKTLLPDALFIGFTGTPLLKTDKKTSVDIFGNFIHVYRYNEAVEDGVVLDLRYEARKIDQEVVGKEQIDQWFDAKTRGLSDFGKNVLKQRWATLQKIFSSRERLERIAADIMLDFERKDRLRSGRGNALLVSGSIYQACKFYEIFQSSGFPNCAIITSYDPRANELRGEETGEGLTEKLKKYDVYTRMLGGKDVETFESDVKKKFVEEPAQMQLLIVVDKLLTGFDAPKATYLYIDKQMQNHGLFQAICRVNRVDHDKDDDGRSVDDKEYGYIIDYKDLFKSLETAMKDYTTEAFEEYEKEDVDGLLKDSVQAGRQRLDLALEQIRALCEPVEPPKGTMEYIRFFCAPTDYDEDENIIKAKERKRHLLYKYTAALIRAYAEISNDMAEAGYSDAQVKAIKAEIEEFEKIRQEIKIRSSDYVDLKTYEPGMRHLIDNYIRAGLPNPDISLGEGWRKSIRQGEFY